MRTNAKSKSLVSTGVPFRGLNLVALKRISFYLLIISQHIHGSRLLALRTCGRQHSDQKLRTDRMTYKDWLQVTNFHRTRFEYVPVRISAWNLTVCYFERPVTENWRWSTHSVGCNFFEAWGKAPLFHG